MTDVEKSLPHQVEGHALVEVFGGTVTGSGDAGVPAKWSSWSAKPVAPWRRYFARLLDILMNGLFVFTIIGLAWGIMAPLSAEAFFSLFDGTLGRVADLMLTIAIAGLVNVLLMSFVGSTLGKFIFGVKVLTLNGKRLSLGASFQRELKIWVRGLGIGIPLFSFIALLVSYSDLTKSGVTRWDEGDYQVIHRPAGTKQTILNLFGVALIAAGRALLVYLQ